MPQYAPGQVATDSFGVTWRIMSVSDSEQIVLQRLGEDGHPYRKLVGPTAIASVADAPRYAVG
ncbi:MAG: hypothetical protein IRY92_06710, partial [Dactylosporangium sp.]|nr:hypothetical protein [Dactylosporangium sp.]